MAAVESDGRKCPYIFHIFKRAGSASYNSIGHFSHLLNVPQQEQEGTENSTLQEDLSIQNLRITVLGRTGEGKSSILNTILGRPAFKVGNSPFSITNSSSYASCMYNGRRITVVDTPGIHSNTQAKSAVVKELKRTAILLPDGVHCFIICMNMSDCRFNEETDEMLETIKQVFGNNAFNYCLLVYTKAKTELNYGSLEDFLIRMKEHPGYCHFLEEISDRVFTVNNATTTKEQEKHNRQNIIKMVEDVVRKNKLCKRPEVFTNALFEKAKKIHDELPKGIFHPSIANAVVEVARATSLLKMVYNSNFWKSEVVKILRDSELCEITDEDFTFSNDGSCATFSYKACNDHIAEICSKTKKSIIKRHVYVLIGLAGIIASASIISSIVIYSLTRQFLRCYHLNSYVSMLACIFYNADIQHTEL